MLHKTFKLLFIVIELRIRFELIIYQLFVDCIPIVRITTFGVMVVVNNGFPAGIGNLLSISSLHLLGTLPPLSSLEMVSGSKHDLFMR